MIKNQIEGKEKLTVATTESLLADEHGSLSGGLRGKAELVYLRVRSSIRDFLADNSGMGTVEIILIIVVLIGLVVVFKSGITSVVNNIITRIGREATGV